MSKKQDAFYFETFVSTVEDACQAAEMLEAALGSYDPDHLERQLEAIHTVEHTADGKKHQLMNVLVKAFITPIEREDIIALAQNIDEVVDRIEDVLIRMHCCNIRTVRPDALAMVDLLVRCCAAVKDLMDEFADFKRSKKLKDHIVAINSIEEEADRLYMRCLRELHCGSMDPMEVMGWHEVYTYLEKCVDACEHVADTVETVIMKNT